MWVLDCELQRTTHSTHEVSASLLPGIIKQRTNINFTMTSKCRTEFSAMWYCEHEGSSSSEMLASVYQAAQQHILEDLNHPQHLQGCKRHQTRIRYSWTGYYERLRVKKLHSPRHLQKINIYLIIYSEWAVNYYLIFSTMMGGSHLRIRHVATSTLRSMWPAH